MILYDIYSKFSNVYRSVYIQYILNLCVIYGYPCVYMNIICIYIRDSYVQIFFEVSKFYQTSTSEVTSESMAGTG